MDGLGSHQIHYSASAGLPLQAVPCHDSSSAFAGASHPATLPAAGPTDASNGTAAHTTVHYDTVNFTQWVLPLHLLVLA